MTRQLNNLINLRNFKINKINYFNTTYYLLFINYYNIVKYFNPFNPFLNKVSLINSLLFSFIVIQYFNGTFIIATQNFKLNFLTIYASY